MGLETSTIQYLYVGDVFILPVAYKKYAIFNKTITLDMSCWKLQTLMQLVSSGVFCCKSAYLEPNPTYKYVTPTRPRTLSIKVVIVY